MEPGYTPTVDTTSKPTSDDQQIIARPDSMLDACLRRRRPLLYSAGPDADDDRPTHVRAGSGLAWLGGRLCVVQDDANFLALCDLSSGAVEATALPRGAGDRRLFDETLGNKPDKLDLEACVVAEVDGVEVLLALGSGSTSRWEHVALVHLPGGGSAPVVRMIHAPALYTALRQRPELCGSELNIEGAVLLPSGHVRLFQRGNGAPGGGLMPVDATCDLPWDDLWSYLQGLRADAPSPEDVTQYALGQMQGVRLTFCDATLAPGGRILYLAGAEDSPDTVQDGEVCGAAVGVIARGGARWAPLADEDGELLAVKAEGVALHPEDPRLALVVIDADDPDAPSELLEVELEGPWW